MTLFTKEAETVVPSLDRFREATNDGSLNFSS
jgi:hypothetical protein